MIGDQLPNFKTKTKTLMERYNIENPREIDWEKGIINLKNEGIKLYGV